MIFQRIPLVSNLKNAIGSKNNHSAFEQFNSTVNVDDHRLRAYGINPRKYKNRLFRQQQNCTRDGPFPASKKHKIVS